MKDPIVPSIDEKIPVDEKTFEKNGDIVQVSSFNSSSAEEHQSKEYLESVTNLIEFDDVKISTFYASLDNDLVELFLKKTGHGHSLGAHKTVDGYDESSEASALPLDLKFFITKILASSNEWAFEYLKKLYESHCDDSNFPSEDLTYIKSVIDNYDAYTLAQDPKTEFHAKLLAVLSYYHSPYPEVRSVTDIFNDITQPVETIRSYTLAIIFVILSSGIKEFFAHRQPAISLSTSICAILMYPIGVAWGKIVPDWSVNFFGKKLKLNPGEYTFKEQMFAVLTVMAASANVYVSYNIMTQIKFYHHTWVHFGYQFLLVFSTQLMGFSFAGILRKFVIYPGRAVWPTVLPSIALNIALTKPERRENVNGWKVSKYKFFWIGFAIMFCYFWLPDYLFTALSTFNWMNWIAPENFNLAIVTGTNAGLGLNPISTFDWNIVTSCISPLSVPFVTMANYYVGAIIGFICIIGVYFSNYKWTGYLPINSNAIYTNEGERYNISKVLTNNRLDVEKYQKYSPPFYSAANLVLYSAFFFVYPFTFLFNGYKEWTTIKQAFILIYHQLKKTYLNFRQDPKSIFKKNSDEQKTLLAYDDPHARMMSYYKEVPDSWYFLTLIISLIFAIVCVTVYKETLTPVWGIFFVVAINFVFLIPFTLLYAVTGVQYGLNVLVELIVGYAINNGMALMTLKALGYNIDGQAENFVSAQKIAHYCKIYPRALFRAQFIGTIIQGLVFIGVINWSVSNIDGLCDPKQPQHFTCPSERTYFSAAVFWGDIGPKIVFDGLYPIMKHTFWMGFLFAVALIIWMRYFPRYWSNKIEPAVGITGILNTYAPYNLAYITPALYVSYFFMYYVKKRFPAWFAKFTYVFSAAMDSGVALSAVVIFFAVQYHPKNIDWWGNTVSNQGIEGGDGRQTYLNISDLASGYFGPRLGHYPTNHGTN